MMRWVWLCVLLPGLACANPVLDRVVIVSRHGVRAPTKPPATLNPYAAQTWPDWPVPPGELTAHGAADLKLMGAWLRAHYAAAGLWPAQGCLGGDKLFVWADGKDHRTIDSGDALLDGLSPGCALKAAHGKPAAPDPVFAALEAGACPLAGAEIAALKPRLEHKLAQLPPDYAASLAALQAILAPSAESCAAGVKCLTGTANTLVAGEEGPRLKGPLATGSSLAEDLALEYDEGFAGDRLGWGRVDMPALTQVMRLHNLYSSITRRDPVIGGHNGAVLAAKILDALQGKPALPAQNGQTAAMTMFVGHDTTLDNLAAIFGVEWSTPDQPDATPPEGELVFEIYSDNNRGAFAKILFRYETADELRAGADAPPREIALSPAYCGGDSCPLDKLVAQVKSGAAPLCVSAAE
jgi:4-phytase/acid phosphatase